MEKQKIQAHHIEKMKSFGIILEDYSEVELFKYKKGEAIIREGFPMEHLFFVQSGKAKVFASADNGRDLLLGYYVEGGIMSNVGFGTLPHSTGLTIYNNQGFPIQQFTNVGNPKIQG